MKRNLLTLLSIVIVLFLNNQSKAQSLIYYWNFNGVDSSIHTPDYTVSGGGSATYAYWCAYTDYNSPGAHANVQLGDSAGSCIRFRNPSDSVVFFMPTTGYGNVTFSYAEQRTGSGASTNTIDYSTDGVHFKPSSFADVVDSSTYTVDSTDAIEDSIIGWQFKTFSFAADTTTNNNAHFAISIVFNGVSTASSGNDRFDNVALLGAPLSALGISNTTVTQPSYILFPNPATTHVDITAGIDGNKSLTVTNMIGQVVYKGIADDRLVSINTATLHAGVYFITIQENTTGSVTTLKFIKQ